MKLEELNKWIASHEYVTCASRDTDSCGNVDTEIIYRDSTGRLFRLEFMNNHPYEKWGDKGFIRGEYSEPVEVVKKQRMVDYYEPK